MPCMSTFKFNYYFIHTMAFSNSSFSAKFMPIVLLTGKKNTLITAIISNKYAYYTVIYQVIDYLLLE